MASRKNGKKYPTKYAASDQESPAIEEHLMQLGAHHSLKIQYDHGRGGCANQCLLTTQLSEEQRPRALARASTRSQM